MNHEGGCLCGTIRYTVKSDPKHVTFCHCKFCQRSTGAAYLVEPIFDKGDFALIAAKPSTYDHRSTGSDKIVTINFCANCGTKLFLSFERFVDVIGVFGGTFDDPNWFDCSSDQSKHIFLDDGQNSTVIPSGYKVFHQHAAENDGSVNEPTIFDTPHMIGAEFE